MEKNRKGREEASLSVGCDLGAGRKRVDGRTRDMTKLGKKLSRMGLPEGRTSGHVGREGVACGEDRLISGKDAF